MGRATRRLIALSPAVLGLAACGGGQQSSENRAAPVRLSVAVSLLPSEQGAYQEIVAGVGRALGVEVKVTALQYDDIRRALAAEVMGGRGTLDVVEADVYALAAVAPHVRPLPNPEEVPSLNASALQAGVVGGERRFLPHRLAWQALIYNAEEISEPPATWEELLAIAEQHSGAIGLKADLYEGLTCDLLPFLWQAGGDPLVPDSSANADALGFLQRLAPHLNPASPGYREGSVLAAQEHGEVVLHLNWPFAVPQLRAAGVLPSRHRAAPLPAGPGGRATVLGGGYLGVSVVAPHPEAAARFVEAMTSGEVQRRLVAELGWFPVRQDAWDALSEDDRADFAGFIAMAEHVRARPVRENYPEISALWQEAFQRAAVRGEDAEDVLADIAARMPAD